MIDNRSQFSVAQYAYLVLSDLVRGGDTCVIGIDLYRYIEQAIHRLKLTALIIIRRA